MQQCNTPGAASTGGADCTTNNNDKKSKNDGAAALPAAFQKIPQRLRIQVIYSDDDIIVVSKPCGLRSVPGNANSEEKSLLSFDRRKKRPRSPSPTAAPTTSTPTPNVEEAAVAAASSQQQEQQPQQRLTAQQAWTEAIRLLAATSTNSSNICNDSSKEGDHGSDDDDDSVIQQQLKVYLQRLGSNSSHLASIPRKYAPFCRYIRRSHSRIFQNDKNDMDDDSRWETLIRQIYCCIEMRQRSLLHLPEPTRNEESVLGQLKLLGFSSSSSSSAALLLKSADNDFVNDSRSNQDLFPVHRLDCETSGVMVVARNRNAASVLSRAWREKSKIQNNNSNGNSHINNSNANNNNDGNNSEVGKNNNINNKSNIDNKHKNIIQVHKVYHALVYDWKPWREQRQTQGQIDLALAPHPTQRIKWVAVHPNKDNGGGHDSNYNAKPSHTHWRVLENHHHHQQQQQHGDKNAPASPADTASATTMNQNAVRLELLPITGRTHQLRIHCAETGGAIIGDSLYFAAAVDSSDHDRMKNNQVDGTSSFLHLHAYQLTFPHPRNEEREMKFTVDPAW